jgi:hypothetical protein
MGMRPDLDLSDILPAYQGFLTGEGTSTAGINRIRATPEGDVWEPKIVGDEESIPTHLYWDWGQTRDRSKPILVGNGPKTCSTSQVMALGRPLFSWDVNGWYRTLGVPFPYINATSGVLSQSYVANGGQESARATYYLKRLLNRPVRASYDLSELGSLFLDDEYVQDEIKARAAAEAGRRSARGSYTDPRAVMDEWGLVVEEKDDEEVDTGPDKVLTGVQPEDSPDLDPVEWVYSYWLWNTEKDYADSVQLERWQNLLVSAVALKGLQLNIAVGLAGSQPEGYAVTCQEGTWVMYLEEGRDPTAELAGQAAEVLLNQITN